MDRAVNQQRKNEKLCKIDQLQIVIIEFSTAFLKIRICFDELNLNNIQEIAEFLPFLQVLHLCVEK